MGHSRTLLRKQPIPRERRVKPGTPHANIIVEFTKAGVEHSLHATKGWRRKRVG